MTKEPENSPKSTEPEQPKSLASTDKISTSPKNFVKMAREMVVYADDDAVCLEDDAFVLLNKNIKEKASVFWGVGFRYIPGVLQLMVQMGMWLLICNVL